MAKSLKPGDPVRWESSGGTSHGTVEKKLTGETRIKGHKVSASPEEPQFLVKSGKSGGKAAHKPEALRKE
ncbi:DUF2945 domain-containing protein [Roseomonas gilardii]|uniref:DUF2945 domain-containing protein n=1 Tax=Roseomonas gilardii TaxID=257708 RepID=UPI0011A8FB1F|nr:DUF2945 domain-containing protein [Roseomonas gilardii]